MRAAANQQPRGGPAGDDAIRRAIEQMVGARFPGARVVAAHPFGADEAFGDDEGDDDATAKAIGYGKPVAVRVALPDGSERRLVLHAAAPGAFGHERRADRAAEILLAYDSFDRIPGHVAALDVGALTGDGRFLSLADTGELYLLTSYAEGELYAEELRAVARRGQANERDVGHAALLGRYLASLHQPIDAPPSSYQRAIRDLVGDGQGIFGIVDSYPPTEPVATPARLEAYERLCLGWRWRLKPRSDRLRRTHGDFHPFNLVFDGDELALLDTSRGSMGEPADDLAALAVNYPFFAIQHPGSWSAGLRPLYEAFFEAYFAARHDDELLDVIAPFWAWRTLVVASPVWYPDLAADHRDRLLALAEAVLAAPRFDLAMVERIFT
ncbi:MAG: phosphotransferase [Myxococcales bacterium]|nr:phosphotransferase [Myxococcales bacterium]